jgi:hypothetical protein
MDKDNQLHMASSAVGPRWGPASAAFDVWNSSISLQYYVKYRVFLQHPSILTQMLLGVIPDMVRYSNMHMH